MAFCAYCGHEISDRAPMCPSCGHPQAGLAHAAPTQRTDGNAIAALALGVASFVICPLVPAILAVIFGNKAKQNIARDAALEGEAMARAGVILGWVNIGLVGALVTLFVILAAVGAFKAQ